MSDRLTAWVRTVVPALWSTLVAWLVSLGLPAAVTGAAAGLGEVLVVPVALAAVYALLRWLEPRLPAWLAVVLLGSTRAPTYDDAVMSPGATVATQLAALDSVASLGRSAETWARTIRQR